MEAKARRLSVRSKLTLTAGTAAASVGAVATAVALAAAPTAQAAGVTILGSGSSAASTEVNALIAKYEQLNPNVTIKYNADGGNAGITDLQQGASEFSIQTAGPSAATDGGVTFNKIFGDAVIIGVNKKNKLTGTNFKTVKNIFTGLDTKWTQVKGSKNKGAIDPYGRNTSSGLYTLIQKAVLYPSDQANSVTAETSDGEVAVAIAHDVNGIGYIGLASADKEGVRQLALSSGKGKPVAPTRKNIAKGLKSGDKSGYPLAHYDWGVLPNKNPNPDAAAFIHWIQTSSVAKGIINVHGGLSL